MKTFQQSCLGALILTFLIGFQLNAQDNMRPQFVILTYDHWNFDNTDGTIKEWEAMEKEYLEKVTKKNDHIMSTATLTHMYTADNTDVVFVSTYKTWEDIEKAQAKTSELEKAAWPDQAARNAFLNKLGNYYTNNHSDEIYATIDGAKLPAAPNDSSMVVYMQKLYLAFPDDGTNAEFEALRIEFAEKVIHKNPHVKAFYPMRHAWGGDNRELLNVYIVESLCDVAEMNQATSSLIEAAWPDEAARNAFFDKWDKYLTGRHGDFLYTTIPEISK